MHRLCRHLVQLRYVKWKVSVAWPLIRSICPQVKTLNLIPITPLLAERQYVSWEEEEIIRNKAILFFFLLPRIDKLQPLSKWRGRTWYIIIWKACHSSCRCCVGNPLRPKGRVIYWASTLCLSQHLLAEDLLAHPYSLMIITDHLPKWLINKAKARQIIYLYGSVDIKFRVNGLKRIRGLGRQVMNGLHGCHENMTLFNKFAESCSLPPPFAFLSLSFSWKYASAPRFVCWLSANVTWDITFLQRKDIKRYNCQGVWIQTFESLVCTKCMLCST